MYTPRYSYNGMVEPQYLAVPCHEYKAVASSCDTPIPSRSVSEIEFMWHHKCCISVVTVGDIASSESLFLCSAICQNELYVNMAVSVRTLAFFVLQDIHRFQFVPLQSVLTLTYILLCIAPLNDAPNSIHNAKRERKKMKKLNSMKSPMIVAYEQ